MSVPEVNVMPVAIRMSVWPDSAQCLDSALWCCTVAWQGYGNWAVLRGCDPALKDPGVSGTPVLGRDGYWHHEKLPSERTREEIADHRFPLKEALELARAMAPRVTINGLTAAEAVARHQAKGTCPACAGPYVA